MKIPNLFDHATSELSQDAFICWLLSWASPSLKAADSTLHKCGWNLLSALFRKHGKGLPADVVCVKATTQDNRIDVLCTLKGGDGAKYAVLIEDKVGTKQHSGQLERYKGVIGQEYDEDKIVLIYFKTHDQSSYHEVRASGYEPFVRAGFLEVLDSYGGDNAILTDYRNHLQGIEDQYQSYATDQLGDWRYHQWVGFFGQLQKRLKPRGNWRVVNPPGGGQFCGYWWGGRQVEDADVDLYLQIQENDLCFKIAVDDNGKRSHLRNQWHERILAECKKDSRGLQIAKPKKFGTGGHMTVCVCENFRVAREDGILDFEKTLERLQQAMGLLDAVASR